MVVSRQGQIWTSHWTDVLQWQAQHEASQRCARFSPKSLETRALETSLPESRGQGYSKHPTSGGFL